MRLCRYGIDDWLEQSELLTGQDAADALAALEAAPAKGDRMCTMALTGPVVQVSSAEAQGRVTLDACHGFSWDGDEHDLTADVLYWVLSPGWSGGVEGDVPMPDSSGSRGSLRRRTGRTCERRIRPVLLQGRPGWPAYLSWFPWLVPRAHRSVEAWS